ncbi:hypothetical protein PENANT_c041G05580 [Penicillium antarcticum]|uniref:Major facilitator superfamily (MFS) profile domain-containing protein n=1 Tax=Penicillium antarcticum TaxID=416450 RepID=A0A1V6PTA3_9EURO|nr:hypothetical protein PENANT_c041G05580 [Penicillium antarcticum]
MCETGGHRRLFGQQPIVDPAVTHVELTAHCRLPSGGSNAKIAGLTEDLGLSGIQYNIALSLFFIPYVLLEVPSNILLKTFTRPSYYLGILIVSWGIITTLTGAVQNFGGLLAGWVLSRCGLPLLTVVHAEGSRNPLSGKWLEVDEIRYLELQHFIKEGGKFKEEKKKTSWKEIRAVIMNWRMYLLAYILLCQSACSYGTKFTLPTITKGMGFEGTNAQLMTVPPYVAGAISAVFFSTLSDRFYWRMPFVVAPLLLIITGYSIIMGLKGQLQAHIGPGFFAIILTCMGIYPTHPATTSWTMNNLAPSNRRAIGSAFNICVGNIGGIIGSYMYLDREGPTYPTGFGLSLAFGGSALLAALILEVSFVYANKRNGMMSESEIRDKYSDEQLLEMGDKSPLFKYTL